MPTIITIDTLTATPDVARVSAGDTVVWRVTEAPAGALTFEVGIADDAIEHLDGPTPVTEPLRGVRAQPGDHEYSVLFSGARRGSGGYWRIDGMRLAVGLAVG